MTKIQRLRKRLRQTKRSKLKLMDQVDKLKDRVECLEELSLAESRRDNLVLRIRKTIKTGVLNIRTAIFLFDIMDHQIARHRKYNELKKRREEGIDLTGQETWYWKNLFYKNDGLNYFLCTTKFLEDSMGVPKSTQHGYIKELVQKELASVTVKKPTRGRQLRYIYINVANWDSLITAQEDRDKAKYRKPVDW